MGLALVVLLVGFAFVAGVFDTMANPQRRLRTGRPLAFLDETTKCRICRQPGVTLALRNAWLADMPVCSRCHALANPHSAIVVVAAPPRVRRDISAESPPGKPEPRF